MNINGEHYYQSSWKPREILNVNLGLVRVIVWGPIPFISLTLGWPHKDNAHALQLYAGVKCDGTKTYEYGKFMYRMDWKEMFTLRWHKVDAQPEWDNQGGA
ncbi:MAG: hypothetical protein KGI05_04565 [Thaumarchaeota archaeon]|nr:hypothetical protein [Nitrososphaerota archaeon]